MLRKYRLEATEMLTGEKKTRDVECDAYITIGFLRGEDAEFKEIRLVVHGVGDAEIVNAMYSDDVLRKAAILCAECARIENGIFRRLIRKIFGGCK